MSRRLLTFLLLATTVVVAGSCNLVTGRSSKRPVRHVLLISIDTCRADHLGCYNPAHLQTTPNLDALAGSGTVFTRAQSTNSLTFPAHSSILTGTTPLYHRVHDNNNYHLTADNITLAETMQANGYRTGAVVGAYVIGAATGLNQGFDNYDDKMPTRNAQSAGWNINERRGNEVSAAASAWLTENHSEPFFLFLHYFDPHHAYDPPEPFLSQHAGDAYAGEIAFTDHCIGQVVAKLKDLGVYDDTLIIVTSDHGESFGEHDEWTHSFFAYETTIRVPLIIKAPGAATGVRIEDPVSIVDIAPTILALANLEAPPHLQGLDLADTLFGGDSPGQDRFVYCESTFPTRYNCSAIRGLTRGRWKYLHSAKPELYDLVDDPNELKNLVDEEPQVANDLLLELREMFQQRRELKVADDAAGNSADRLQSLGYIGGGRVNDADSFDGPEGAEDPKTFIRFHGLISAAMGAYAAQNFADARAKCLEVVQHRPYVPDSYALLGKVARAENNHAEAVGHFNRYLAVIARLGTDSDDPEEQHIDSNTVDVYVLLGSSLVSLGQFEEAIAILQKALQILPDHGPAYRQMGLALRGQGKIDEAVEALRKAVSNRPDDAQGHLSLALTLESQRKHVEAVEVYRRALELNPDLDRLHFGLGRALIAIDEFAEGKEHLLRAGKSNTAPADRANDMAWFMAAHPDPHRRSPERAVVYAEAAAELTQHRSPQILDTLAVAYAANGDFDRAVETAEKAIAIAIENKQPKLAASIGDRVALYLQSKPFVIEKTTPKEGNLKEGSR